jgi:tetratricopeptide (TPR) repeat protein
MARHRRPARSPAAAAPPGSSEAAGSNAWVLLAAGIALVAATVTVYAPAFSYGFVSIDDPRYVPDNPHVVGGLTWANVVWVFSSQWASYWIPLTWVSYMLEVQAFGMRPDVMHVTNVALHAANTLLLFSWLRRSTGATGRSALAAALFALHPLHVESVAWITERKDVLSTFFLLLALHAYTKHVRQPSRSGYAAIVLWFVLGLLAKPMLVTLPLLLLACDIWPLGRVPLEFGTAAARRRWRQAIREKWPLAMIGAAGAVVVVLTQRGAMALAAFVPLERRIANAIVSTAIYLWQTIVPVDLAVLYAYPEAIPAWQVGGALLLLAAATFMLLRSRRPYLVAGWAWFLVALAPVSGVIQVGIQPRADRFMYVPLIGLFAAFSWAGWDVVRASPIMRRAAAGAAVLLVAVSGVGARHQVGYWRDSVTLWRRAADVTPGPGGAQAQFELARQLVETGQLAEAVEHYRIAIQDKPDWGGAYGLMGIALALQGKQAEARLAYEDALRLDPEQPEIHNNLGVMIAAEGRFEAALAHFDAAVRLKPEFDAAGANLGLALERLGRPAEARRAFRAALAINPANVQARLGLDRLGGGR